MQAQITELQEALDASINNYYDTNGGPGHFSYDPRAHRRIHVLECTLLKLLEILKTTQPKSEP